MNKQNKKPHLSVVIPCYNEEKNLKRGILQEIEDFLARQSYTSEVIISDDGSTDESLKLVQSFNKAHPRFRVLENPHAGKPFAVKSGVLAARGEITLFTDMDQSTPISQLDKLLPHFQQGFQVVVGSRGKERRDFPWYRQLLSWGFRLVRRAALLSDIVDTQCGFKAFTAQAGKEIFARMQIFKKAKNARGWKVGAWDVELLFVADKLGFKIKEVPVAWQDRDIAQGKKKDFLKESWEMLTEIARVKLNDWRGKYG